MRLDDVRVVQRGLDVHFHLEAGGVGDLMSLDPPRPDFMSFCTIKVAFRRIRSWVNIAWQSLIMLSVTHMYIYIYGKGTGGVLV